MLTNKQLIDGANHLRTHGSDQMTGHYAKRTCFSLARLLEEMGLVTLPTPERIREAANCQGMSIEMFGFLHRIANGLDDSIAF